MEQAMGEGRVTDKRAGQADAGRQAGTIKDGGRMVVLMPVEYALAKTMGPLE